MNTIALLGAAGLSAVWAGVHLFVGEAQVARPLRRADGLTPLARDTAWLCWHFVSITLVLMAALFFLGAMVSVHYAVAGVLLAGGFVGIGVLLVPVIGQNFRTLPQGWLFVPVVALGLMGVLG